MVMSHRSLHASEAAAVSHEARDAAKVATDHQNIGLHALYRVADLAEIVSELADEVEYVWAVLVRLDPDAAAEARAGYERDVLLRIRDRASG